jgi:large subunit ribosomal protein L4
MASAPLYNAAGQQVGEETLPEALFAQPERPDLVYQALERERANRRQGTHATLTRAEVRGGGRKPYRQKGTGRARQGSIRAPHYRHGGVVHGPTPRSYEKDMPRKMRRAAFRAALSTCAASGGIRVLEELEVPEISTRRFAEWLRQLAPRGRTVLVLNQRHQNAWLSARNLPEVRVFVLPGLSTTEVARADTLIFTREALALLEELYAA